MALKSIQLFIAILITTLSGAALAVPIMYDIELTATSGTGGSGSFSVDSATLAAMPATGYYESDFVFSTGEATWLGGTVNDLYFGDVWRNGFAFFIAADGLASDITALANDGLVSFDTLGDFTEHELVFESDGSWDLWSYWPFVDNWGKRSFVAEGEYKISRVSEPPILVLMALGVVAIGFVRRKKATC